MYFNFENKITHIALLMILVLNLTIYKVKKEKSVFSYPSVFVIQEFPLLKQPDQISCGPTACAMVLNYFNNKVSIKEVKKIAKTEWFEYKNEPVGMTSPDYMAKALTYFGVNAKLEIGNLEKIKYYVSQNRPPIVLLRSGKSLWHYVVVVGYNRNMFLVADPGWGFRQNIKAEILESSWNFSSDMSGHKMTIICPTCGGDGKISWIPKPIGACDLCGGSGEIVDFYKFALGMVDVRGFMMIVPEK